MAEEEVIEEANRRAWEGRPAAAVAAIRVGARVNAALEVDVRSMVEMAILTSFLAHEVSVMLCCMWCVVSGAVDGREMPPSSEGSREQKLRSQARLRSILRMGGGGQRRAILSYTF